MIDLSDLHSGIAFDFDFVAGRSDWVIGVDEVGRGCLAGAVVAAAYCVRLDQAAGVLQVRDSKQLSAKQRESIAKALQKIPDSCTGYGLCSVDEIDCLNIGKASLLAMARALKELRIPDRACLLADGRFLPSLEADAPYVACKAVIKGDVFSWVIGAASILAKVRRDAMMLILEDRWPGYNFAKHKGYGTKDHRSALNALGPTPEHRRSFKPVQDCLRRAL